MEKEILEKWNNTCIYSNSLDQSFRNIEFFESMGFKNSESRIWCNCYYGLFDGILESCLTVDKSRRKVITLEEAIAIRDNVKTFPREMYVWDFDIESAEKEMVYFIVEKSMEVDQPVLVVNGQTSFVYGNAMEIEEYEALTKKQNENDELIKQIEKTEKELAELKSKLK